MTRTEQITALLRSLFDYLPDPKTASYGDLPGPAPSAWADCKPCQGIGHFGKAKRLCAACDGTGTVKVDSYTGEPVGTSKTPIHAADTRRIDAELAKLSRDEAIRRGRMLDDPFAWEAQRIRYRQAGSYASIERALDSLRANEPDLCSVLMATTVYGWAPVTDANRPTLERALEFIARRMPQDVRVPKWVTDDPPAVEREWPADRRRTSATTDRNATIIDLSRQGKKGREIAEYVGCSAATVSRVLRTVDLAGTAA